MSLIATFPLIGIPLAHDGPFTIRRLRWTRAPYVCWYAHEEADVVKDVWLIRLFHARQRRPQPDPLFWHRHVGSAGQHRSG